MTDRRLIEVAFPLKQASLDSLREKYGPKGHISGFHLWPARRPLAASRAAFIATLLQDPGTPETRKKLAERIGGVVKRKIKRKKKDGLFVEQIVEETDGGVLRWGRESGPEIDWFREEIRKAYGGRAPRVLDPFAGGGAIPLEAMRLGCEVTAVDINPVAWFILKCTLEYPQKLAGQTRPLPEFALRDPEFMAEFLKKARGLKGKKLQAELSKLGLGETDAPALPGIMADANLDADLAWHVRAWGRWVLARARQELARLYPTYADFQPLDPTVTKWRRRDMTLVPLKADGTLDLAAINAEFDEKYLNDPRKPRWVLKPTVAYLWARTVKCKLCRANLPLLKTRWLCRIDDKRVIFAISPNREKTAVVFNIETNVSRPKGNASQRREHDKRIGAGTMSRSGATCPCCEVINTIEDIRLEGQAGRLGVMPTVVVVDGPLGKEYRLPTEYEVNLVATAETEIGRVFAEVPFGLPEEPTPAGGGAGAGRAFSVQGYGLMKWRDLFTARQLVALGTFTRNIHAARIAMVEAGYPPLWSEALGAYLATALDRLVDHSTSLATWYLQGENVKHTFVRYALPIIWDFAESNTLFSGGGSWNSAITFTSVALDHALSALTYAPTPTILNQSAIKELAQSSFDVIMTDPPYYDAIPYSDLMDCFYVWLRRTTHGLGDGYSSFETQPLSPKWDHSASDGELIDDESRHGGDGEKSKSVYEEGMARAFQACFQMLHADGRLVIVFAHKQPDAWETLVSAIIRSGFVVDGSWPIQTENATRSRARASAALASSVWLVCKKRQQASRPGWDNRVLEAMRANIYARLREYWDAGIRGPDFVWAATGPALEAYSQHPVVKKANEPNQLMTVTEFLRHVRRIVVDFVVGRVLFKEVDNTAVDAATTGLDDVTTYYLLHRHDFGMEDAPIGACILYAVSCGLSDNALADQYDILIRTGGKAAEEDDGDEGEDEVDELEEEEEGSGSVVRLKAWSRRNRKTMGYDPAVDSPRAKAAQLQPVLMEEAEPVLPKARAVPLIDQVHRLMHLWKAGDVVRVNEYLDARALAKNALFHQLLQALIELAPAGSEERSLLESISNHMAAQGVKVERPRLIE